MCVLCGQDFVAVHWTDRHVEDLARSAEVEVGDYHRKRRRNRSRRVKLVNEVLGHYGLKAVDWSGSKYLVRDQKGNSELVQDLGSLWPAAAKIAGREPDPLDPTLQETLSAAFEGEI